MPDIQNPGNGDQGNSGAAAGAAGEGQKPPETPKQVTMTQEELDRIIADRVARAKPKDYDELVALRDKQKADEDAKKDELTKAQEKAAKAEADAQAAVERANQTLIRAAIMAEAAAQNAVDPAVVIALLAGTDDVTITDAGEVKGAKKAVAELLKDKPYLVKAAAGPAGASGGQFGGNDQRTLPERIREAESKGDWAEARRLKASQLVPA